MTLASVTQNDPVDELDELAPDAEQITPYDRLHLSTYLNLLRAYVRDDGPNCAALQAELARIADLPPSPIRTILSHLRLALWMLESGYHPWSEQDVEIAEGSSRD